MRRRLPIAHRTQPSLSVDGCVALRQLPSERAFNQLAALSELHACNCWQLFNNHPVELEKIPKKVKLVGAPKDLSLKLLLDA